MTKTFEVYTQVDKGYTYQYSIHTAIAILIGSFTSNFFSIGLISVLGKANAMTIPNICITRNLLVIPTLYMMFWVQNNFYVSIAGFYLYQILAKGWIAPALLMLKTVVPPDVASLSIGIFLIFIQFDYIITGLSIQETISNHNFKIDSTGSYG
jgi:hypothetical protein